MVGRMGKTVVVAALLACGLCGSCSSPADTCNDVSSKICGKLAGCDALDATFSSKEQCVASFNGYFEVDNSDSAACRDEWSVAGSLDCDAFLDHFSL